ncbi:MAG: hypothetical protein HY553_05380, partial [Elusimicrobia bacterium]|nr:hypothetical protein [Elusimicrobiota bacterium]
MMLLTLLVAGRISAEPVDLERAVARALERSGHVAAAAAAGREAEAAGREARRRGWPALSARAAAVRGDHPVYAFGELLEQRRLEPADMALDRLNRPGYVTSLKGALELSVPLYTARE